MRESVRRKFKERESEREEFEFERERQRQKESAGRKYSEREKEGSAKKGRVKKPTSQPSSFSLRREGRGREGLGSELLTACASTQMSEASG